MTTREKIHELMKNARSQTDLDAIVSKAGGINNLYNSVGGDRDEFAYEWDSVKLGIRSITRNN
jgi:hypothetical protein